MTAQCSPSAILAQAVSQTSVACSPGGFFPTLVLRVVTTHFLGAGRTAVFLRSVSFSAMLRVTRFLREDGRDMATVTGTRTAIVFARDHSCSDSLGYRSIFSQTCDP